MPTYPHAPPPLFSQIPPSPSPPPTPVPPFPSHSASSLHYDPLSYLNLPQQPPLFRDLFLSSTSPPTAESTSMEKEAAWAAAPPL
ncbi:unnamed protein product [Linum tenue]|uniref:Uncharacterized protein n=1 Tax=Linum tenue TaxID=586396 RepID=A0AAV0MRM2_9ROSI|nr:unnamed protein product [Linum tenue]